MISFSFSSEMEIAVFEGRKICTTCKEIHGQPGDRFQIRDRNFVIVDVVEGALSDISEYYYLLEGFSEPLEFCDFWTRRYGVQWNGCQNGYVHFFASVGDRESAARSVTDKICPVMSTAGGFVSCQGTLCNAARRVYMEDKTVVVCGLIDREFCRDWDLVYEVYG